MPFRFILLVSMGAIAGLGAVPELPFAPGNSFLSFPVDAQQLQKLIPPKLDELPARQFEKTLQKALSGNRLFRFVQPNQVARANEECAIPLLEWKAKNPERNTAPALPEWNKNADAIAVPPPVPACKNWNNK